MAVRLKNRSDGWGLVSIALHWSMAALVFGMLALGLYMTGLDYMHPWYKAAPELHKSTGLVVLVLLVLRTIWSAAGVRPIAAPGPSWERKAAWAVHRLLYVLLYCMVASGYLISTADGRGVGFFGLFEVPATIYGAEGQEDAAGEVHLFLALTLMAIVALHVAGAVKHHFIDKDDTLVRMLGMTRRKGKGKEGLR